MAHTFLSLDMRLIPQSTKDNLPSFNGGYFSNDKSRVLIDGYNDNRDLVHPDSTFNKWLQWPVNPKEIKEELILTATEYTKPELKAEFLDINSVWFIEVAQ